MAISQLLLGGAEVDKAQVRNETSEVGVTGGMGNLGNHSPVLFSILSPGYWAE